jgi:hypothetical protein
MKSAMRLTIQTLLASRQQEVNRQSFNPNPPGQIKEDSSTDKVLRFLRQHRPRFLTHAQIVEGTGCKTKSVDWALYYLKGLKVIECRRCSNGRFPMHQEYRANAPIDDYA